jgi:hypothetical protein
VRDFGQTWNCVVSTYYCVFPVSFRTRISSNPNFAISFNPYFAPVFSWAMCLRFRVKSEISWYRIVISSNLHYFRMAHLKAYMDEWHLWGDFKACHHTPLLSSQHYNLKPQ